MNQPTILNPNFTIELRRVLSNGLNFCDTLDRFAGIAGSGTSTTIRAHSLAGTGTTGRIVSEATRKKMRLAAKRRLKLHQGGNVRAA